FECKALPPGDWQLFAHGELTPDHSWPIRIDRSKETPLFTLDLPEARIVSGRVAELKETPDSPYLVQAIPSEHVPHLPDGVSTRSGLDLDRVARWQDRVDSLLRTEPSPTPARFQAGYRAAPILSGSFPGMALIPGVAYSLRVLHPSDGYLVPDAFSPPRLLLPRSESGGAEEDPFFGEYVELGYHPTLVYRPQFLSGSKSIPYDSSMKTTEKARIAPEDLFADGLLAVRSTDSTAKAFTLQVDRPDYQAADLSVPFPTQKRTDLLPLIQYLTPADPLRVVVRDSAGRAIEGARVFLAEAFGVIEPRRRSEALTDAEGVAVLRDMPEAPCNLGVRAPGWAPRFLRSPFERRKDGSVQVKLSRGAAVHYQVTDGRGKPTRGALVLRISQEDEIVDLFGWSGGSPSIRFTDHAGIAQFQGLSRGRHRFGVLEPTTGSWAKSFMERSEKMRRERQEADPTESFHLLDTSDPLLGAFDRIPWEATHWVDVTDQNAFSTIAENFGTESRSTLGAVVLQGEAPLRDARVALYLNNESTRPYASARTHVGGGFHLEDLPEGHLRLEIHHHDWDLPFRSSFYVSREHQGHEFHIKLESPRLQFDSEKEVSLANATLHRDLPASSPWLRLPRESLFDRKTQVSPDSFLWSPPLPPALARSDAWGVFDLAEPRDAKNHGRRRVGSTRGAWWIKGPELAPVRIVASDQNPLPIPEAFPLRVEGLDQHRQFYGAGHRWIAAIPRQPRSRARFRSRIVALPAAGDQVLLPGLPPDTYVLFTFDRDGFGRPVDLHALGKATVWGQEEDRFTIRQN
ncbi:MAG: carboxypeptidase-like regulatory domain-containing protein, partial [Planctomycetota bacterium]